MTGYRYPNEIFTLAVALLVVLAIGVIGAGLTLCIAPIILMIFLVMAYLSTVSMHRQVLTHGERVTSENTPQLFELVQECARRLTPGPVDVVVVPSRDVNAYTFGLANPKVIVVNSPMLKIMDARELMFVIGHEMGHVDLGHTWLNTVIGGLAGMPPSVGAAALLQVAFRGWNRSCEYSADRAGMIACGSLQKSTSALVKLVAHNARTPQQSERALQLIDDEDENLGNVLAETFATHPMIIHRIEKLREFAKSSIYKRMTEAR